MTNNDESQDRPSKQKPTTDNIRRIAVVTAAAQVVRAVVEVVEFLMR